MTEHTKRESGGFMGDYYEHPSYAVLSFGRCQGGEQPLFGSSILHHNTVRMEIQHAEYNRSSASDHYFGRKVILTAYMSPTQFADAITGLNSGSSTPITLNFTERDGTIPKPDFIDKRQQYNEDFFERANGIMARITDLEKKAGEYHGK